MYCGKCGCKIEDEEIKFCPECGVMITPTLEEKKKITKLDIIFLCLSVMISILLIIPFSKVIVMISIILSFLLLVFTIIVSLKNMSKYKLLAIIISCIALTYNISYLLYISTLK